ncbi:MAG: hypothetical protein WDN03_16735 [Rhizomicrobium sp.]
MRRALVIEAVEIDLRPPCPARPPRTTVYARLDQEFRGPPLRSRGHDAVRRPRACDQRLAFHDVDADRLLEIDMRARRQRRQRGQCVPVIGRAHDHDVEALLRQHLPVIGMERRAPRLRRHRIRARHRQVRGLRQHRRIDVAQRHRLGPAPPASA